MKETKVAGFTNGSFSAQFDNNVLTGMTVIADPSHGADSFIMSDTEAHELADWINRITGRTSFLGGVRTGDVAREVGITTVQQFPAIQAASTLSPGAVPLEARGKNPSIKISDAESVKNRKPWTAELMPGMVVESKKVDPVEVRIQK